MLFFAWLISCEVASRNRAFSPSKIDLFSLRGVFALIWGRLARSLLFHVIAFLEFGAALQFLSKMTESNQSKEHQGTVIGEFEVSSSAVEGSTIGGPEDLFELAGIHWKSLAVVAALTFIVTSYQGRINLLEDQVGSLRSIYSSLPEEKALAVGALRSVEDLREVLTVVVEERAVELIETEGLFRGGAKVARQVEDLIEISGGFEKLWVGTTAEAPSIYKVVEELSVLISDGDRPSGLGDIQESQSRVAYGVSRYLLAHVQAKANGALGLSSAVSYLRDAERVLSPSSAVGSDLVLFELALGNEAFLRGDSELWVSTYEKWWPQWEMLVNMDDSAANQFRVSHGVAASLVFPFHALTQSGLAGRLSVANFEAALGASVDEAMALGLTSVRKARRLNIDRLPAMIVEGKLDIVLGELLAGNALDERRREKLWTAYQTITTKFQGVTLASAKQTLFESAFAILSEASNVASSHGEALDLSDLGIGDAIVSKLSNDHLEALGIGSDSVE